MELRADKGSFGNLLLDPLNITIVGGSGATDDAQLTPPSHQILFGNSPGANFTLSKTAIENAVGTGNLTLQATNDIKINPLNTTPLTLRLGYGSGSLTFNAGGSFSMNPGDTINSLGYSNTKITITAANVTLGTINTSSIFKSADVNITAQNGINVIGAINTSASGPGYNAGEVTLNSGNGNINIGGDINASATGGSGNNINLTGNVLFSKNASATTTLTTTGTTANGNIIVQGTLNGAAGQNLNLIAGTGNVTFNNSAGNNILQGNLTISSANQVNFNGALTTQNNGSLNINNSGILTIAPGASINLAGAFSQIGTGAVSSAGNITADNNINFNSPVTLTTVNGGAGNITFNGAVGNINPLNSLTTVGSGTTQLNGNVTTIGTPGQNYNNPIQLNNTVTLLSNGNPIFFGSTINGAQSLTVNSGAGNITFTGAVGNSSIPLGNLTSNSSGTTLFNSTVNASSLTTGGGGNTQLNDNVTTSGAQTYGENVILRSPVTLNNSNSNISFTGTVDSTQGTANALAVNATAGNINFTGAVGSITPLGNISLNAGANITTADLITSSSGTSNGGNITLLAPGTINIGSINTSSAAGNGGSVLIDPQSVTFNTINTQSLGAGTGGNVDITATGLVRGLGIFTDKNGSNASISSTGGPIGGSITIRHGGNGITPFIVGNAATNGTNGTLTTGNTTINSGSFLYTYTQGVPPSNISIISVPAPTDSNPNIVNHTTPPQTNVQPQINQPEGRITQDILDYLQPPFNIEIVTLDQTREILSAIEKNTGIKPAIIYVDFVPESVNEDRILNLPKQDSDILEIVVLTAKGIPIRQRIPGVTRKQGVQAAKDFENDVRNFANKRGYKISGKQLYQWLIAPIEADLQARGIQNLAFIMDSGLRGVPLAALYDGEKFLVEKYSVGLMPSLSLTDTRYVDIRKGVQVLAMGADRFTDLDPLPAVPTELLTITEKLWKGKEFLNQEFTLENLKKQRQQAPYGIIHLGTHGQFNAGSLKDSYIQLWDTKLRLDQLRELGLNNPPTELMTLSACKTAVGNEEAELGFAGFAAQAGVKSVVASLWYISAEGTLGLMMDFYQQLKIAPIKAEALRQAQLEMLKGQVSIVSGKLHTPRLDVPLPPALANLPSKDLTHPAYWAAFTMVGSPW